MKNNELALGTVYSDIDGQPLIVLSLDKVVATGRWHGPRYNLRERIRPADRFDTTFGVVVIRLTRPQDHIDADAIAMLEEEARTLAGEQHQGEWSVGEFFIGVATPRSIRQTWAEQLEVNRAEQEWAEAQALARQQRQQQRQDDIDRITALLPEGVSMAGLSVQSPNVTISLTDLRELFETLTVR